MEEQKEGVAGLDQSGHTTVNEYTVIHTLGRGSDGKREIAIMKKLTHTNVTRLHDVIYVHETEKLYILMEYCSKGPLMEFDEDLQKFYFPWSDSAVSDEFI